IETHVAEPVELRPARAREDSRRLELLFVQREHAAELEPDEVERAVDERTRDALHRVGGDECARELGDRVQLSLEARRPLLGGVHALAAADDAGLSEASEEEDG